VLRHDFEHLNEDCVRRGHDNNNDDQLRACPHSLKGADVEHGPRQLVRANACTDVGPVLSSPEARHFKAPRAVSE
jgi:hypothetical protein